MKRHFLFHLKKISFGFVSLLLIGTGIWFFIKSPLFMISTITIHGDTNVLTNPHIIDRPQNFFFLDISVLKKETEQKNPLIKNIRLVKTIPDKLDLYYDARTPIVVIRAPQGDIAIDEERVILPQKPQVSLPVLRLRFIDTIDNERVVTSSVLTSIKILKGLQQQNVTVSTLTIDEETNELWVQTDLTQLRLPQSIDIELFFSSLQLLLAQFRIEGKQPELIDFRFNKPIIRFKI